MRTVLGVMAMLACGAAAANDVVAERIQKLTRGVRWQPVAEIPIGFKTHHPQGMVKIGDAFFVSSVEITVPTKRFPEPKDGYDRDTGEGVGICSRSTPRATCSATSSSAKARSTIPAASTTTAAISGCRWRNTGRTAAPSCTASTRRR